MDNIRCVVPDIAGLLLVVYARVAEDNFPSFLIAQIDSDVKVARVDITKGAVVALRLLVVVVFEGVGEVQGVTLDQRPDNLRIVMDMGLVACARRHDRVAHHYPLGLCRGIVDEELDSEPLFKFEVPHTLPATDDFALHLAPAIRQRVVLPRVTGPPLRFLHTRDGSISESSHWTLYTLSQSLSNCLDFRPNALPYRKT